MGFMIRAAMSAAALLAAGPAAAAVVNLDFVATGFKNLAGGAAAPVDPVTGSFSLTFNDAADVAPTMSGLQVNALNLSFLGPLSYRYTANGDSLYIGTNLGTNGCNVGTSSASFCAITKAKVTDPNLFISYSDGKTGLFEWSGKATTPLPPAVPEPDTWALLLLGFGTVGVAMRRRSRASALA